MLYKVSLHSKVYKMLYYYVDTGRLWHPNKLQYLSLNQWRQITTMGDNAEGCAGGEVGTITTLSSRWFSNSFHIASSFYRYGKMETNAKSAIVLENKLLLVTEERLFVFLNPICAGGCLILTVQGRVGAKCIGSCTYLYLSTFFRFYLLVLCT